MADKDREKQLYYEQWMSFMQQHKEHCGQSKNMYINPHFYKQTLKEKTNIHLNPKFVNFNINQNAPSKPQVTVTASPLIIDKAKSEINNTIGSQNISTSKYQFINTAKPQVISAAQSQPNSTSKYQVINTAKSQIISAAQSQPNSTSKYQFINTAKSQIISAAQSQPNSTSKYQVINTAKPQFISVAKSQPNSTSKYQFINTSNPQVISVTKSQSNSTSKYKFINIEKPQVISAAKSQSNSTSKSQVINTSKPPDKFQSVQSASTFEVLNTVKPPAKSQSVSATQFINTAKSQVFCATTSQSVSSSKYKFINTAKTQSISMPQLSTSGLTSTSKPQVICSNKAQVIPCNSKYGLVRNNPTTPTVINKNLGAINKYKFVKNILNTMNKQGLVDEANKIKPLPPKTTVTVNKYKSININSLKSIVNNKKVAINKVGVSKNKYKIVKTIARTPIAKRNIYKYVKGLNNTLDNSLRNAKGKTNFNSIYTFNRIRNASLNKSVIRTPNKKIKPIRGNFKINNIPCPLFRKFGKCIRKECEFLHDRRHVSICRKFIKGLCHDSSCLLSHELSSKKLPTCYFFLKAMCSKVDCPYLHVKLNNNATICKNFLKGYCEKGEECLQRHVTEAVPLKSKNIKMKAKKVKRVKGEVKVSKPIKTDVAAKGNAEQETLSRYYDNTKNNEEANDCIKPSRCKLGTLPSFIKF